MKKMNIAVLMGGRSAEREISLKTGSMIVKALDREKYRLVPIEISKKGKWPIQTFVGTRAIDFVFIALHGPFGEDGTVQGLLELADVPYSGSGVLGSALCMNKLVSKKLYESAGLAVAPSESFTIEEYQKNKAAVVSRIVASLGLPCVIKPVELGSSVGVNIARTRGDLKKALDNGFSFDNKVIVEKFIAGREFTCGVLGNASPRPLPVTEIIPQGETFYNYKAKYQKGGSRHECPAKIPASLSKRIQQAALTAHRILECRGMSRTDFRFDGKKIFILETNSIPGMTPTSLLPEAAAAAHIPFSKLLDMMIQFGLKDFTRKRRTVR